MPHVLFEAVYEEDDSLVELCVVGNMSAIGNWDLNAALPLTKGDRSVWSATATDLIPGLTVQATFFTRCKITKTLRAWESTHLPLHESVLPADDNAVVRIAVDRLIFEHSAPFLHEQAELQLGFGIRSKHHPIVLTSAGEVTHARISAKMVLANETVVRMNNMNAASDADGEWTQGCPLQLKSRFPAHLVHKSHVILDVAVEGVGLCHAAVSVRQFVNSAGSMELPLLSHSELHVVGALTISYLLAMPFVDPLNTLAGRNSFFPYAHGRTFKVGHRGSGTSQRKAPGLRRASITENTIGSFRKASRRGLVDMVEFDVMLTKDHVPIIYHNWNTRIFAENSASRILDPIRVPVKDLTLAQLHLLRTDFSSEPRLRLAEYIRHNMASILEYGRSEGSTHNVRPVRCSTTTYGWFETIRALERRIPTLEDVFEKIPEHVGFNVEIKFPVNKPGKADRDGFADRNMYVDTILRVIMQHRRKRPVVISCFDPDVCALVKLKQPAIPVMFLTTAGDSWYGLYTDVRCMSIPAAIGHCRDLGLLGICSFAKPLLAERQLISDIKTQNLMLFTWGEDNNIVENTKLLLQLGVDGIIADQHV